MMNIYRLLMQNNVSGHWWVSYQDTAIGYWPNTLFAALSQSSDTIVWGGEIVNNMEYNHHTTTQMGSGHFPYEGFNKTSFVRNIQVLDDQSIYTDAKHLKTYATRSECYDIDIRDWDKISGVYFYFGGPGFSDKCRSVEREWGIIIFNNYICNLIWTWGYISNLIRIMCSIWCWLFKCWIKWHGVSDNCCWSFFVWAWKFDVPKKGSQVEETRGTHVRGNRIFPRPCWHRGLIFHRGAMRLRFLAKGLSSHFVQRRDQSSSPFADLISQREGPMGEMTEWSNPRKGSIWAGKFPLGSSAFWREGFFLKSHHLGCWAQAVMNIILYIAIFEFQYKQTFVWFFIFLEINKIYIILYIAIF